MRIVIDLHDGQSTDRTLCLAETLAQHPGEHRIIIALPAVPPPTSLPTSLTLGQRFTRYLPGEDIRVWHSPGPEAVSSLVQSAFFVGLAPDLLITARRDLFSDLPVIDPSNFPEGASPDWILAAISAAVTAGRNIHAPAVSDHAAVKPTLAVVSPLPPERTGIAGYTADLLPALARYYDIDVIVSQAAVSDPWIVEHCTIRSPDWFSKNGRRYDRILYHIGNSAFHYYMLELMEKHPGVVCLHDFFLGHFTRYVDAKDPASHLWAEQLYGDHGYRPLKDRFHDPDQNRVTVTYPCSFSVFRPALGIIVHSHYTKDLARSWYPAYPERNLVVIPLVRTPVPGEAPGDAAPPTTPLPQAKTSFVVCSFGMLGPFKQNHRLLSAWLNSGLADNPDCHLVFVGENNPGSYGRDLVKTIAACPAKDRIHITGWVTGQDFLAWLNTADAAVQLRTHSRGESSAAVLDCMNHGLPVIANGHGANAELPADALCLVPDRFTEAELIQALDSLYRNPDLREKLGQTAQAFIARHHSPEVCARQYAQAIEGFYHNQRRHRYFLVGKLAALDCLPRDAHYLARLSGDIAANQPDPMPQKSLFIDVSATWRNDLKAGIDRVSRSLVLAMIDNPPQGFRPEPVYLCEKNGIWFYRYARSYTLGLLECPAIGIADDPVQMQAGDRLFCPDLTGGILVAAERTGLFERIRNRGVRIIFTIFDLLPLLRPDVFPPGADKEFHKWLMAVCRSAHQVMCISRSVAQELESWYATDPAFSCLPLPDIDWFHLGADLDASSPSQGMPRNAAETLAKIQSCPCFLMVGTIEPRKGHLLAIAAFERLWAAGIDANLVIVGKQGWSDLSDDQRRTIPKILDTMQNHTLKNIHLKNQHLFWLEGISDEYLDKVYAAADCLIAASEAEGFGLPLIEAAQHGLPVMARDIPVFREVAGDHAFYFSGDDPEELADGLTHWLDLYRNEQHPRSDVMPWNTWRQSCERLIRIIFEGEGK